MPRLEALCCKPAPEKHFDLETELDGGGAGVGVGQQGTGHLVGRGKPFDPGIDLRPEGGGE